MLAPWSIFSQPFSLIPQFSNPSSSSCAATLIWVKFHIWAFLQLADDFPRLPLTLPSIEPYGLSSGLILARYFFFARFSSLSWVSPPCWFLMIFRWPLAWLVIPSLLSLGETYFYVVGCILKSHPWIIWFSDLLNFCFSALLIWLLRFYDSWTMLDLCGLLKWLSI